MTSWFTWLRRPQGPRVKTPGENPAADLDHLLGEISRNLRALGIATRAGRPASHQFRDKVERLLHEMQHALRQSDDALRSKYENRAARMLLEAALAGIVLPPPEVTE